MLWFVSSSLCLLYFTQKNKKHKDHESTKLRTETYGAK